MTNEEYAGLCATACVAGMCEDYSDVDAALEAAGLDWRECDVREAELAVWAWVAGEDVQRQSSMAYDGVLS